MSTFGSPRWEGKASGVQEALLRAARATCAAREPPARCARNVALTRETPARTGPLVLIPRPSGRGRRHHISVSGHPLTATRRDTREDGNLSLHSASATKHHNPVSMHPPVGNPTHALSIPSALAALGPRARGSINQCCTPKLPTIRRTRCASLNPSRDSLYTHLSYKSIRSGYNQLV